MPDTPASTRRPCLILLHGATLNGHMWDPVRRALDLRWEVLTPDLPGHGARRDEPYTLRAAIDTVVQAAAAVAPAPFVVGGDSLGGYSSLAAARSLPQDRLKGLVLCGASTNFSGTMLIPVYLRVALFRVILAVMDEQRLARRSLTKSLRGMGIDEQDIRAMVEQGLSMRVFAQAVAALRGVDFRALLAEVRQPVLVANGNLDKPMLAGEAAFLAAAQRGRLQRFEACEHGVSLRRPAGFAEMVNAFAEEAFAASSLQ